MLSVAEQVKKVIDYSQGIDSNVDVLISKWEAGKADFIRLFGGKSIYSAGHVSVRVGPDREKTLAYQFIDELEDVYDLVPLANFIRENLEGFFENVVVKHDSNRKIPLGMKMLRAFKFFIDDENLLRRVQDRASFYLQQNKIEGELCLSVHPLDFLSMSENNHNWRSCHALDGEFRAGNLSYMCDSSTVVCYIKSESPDAVLGNRFPHSVPWNSKKWRCLLHFSEDKDMMFMSKHYPFHLHLMREEVKAMLQEIPTLHELFPRFGSGWSTYHIADSSLWEDYLKVGGTLIATSALISEAIPILQYNDVVRSSKYEPLYVFHPRYMIEKTKHMPHFSIGSAIPCLICGENLITDSERMTCDECDDYEEYGVCSCDICGRTYDEDEATEVEGYYICPHCVDTVTYRCPRCGELIFENSRVYHPKTDEYYCSDCIEQINENKE